MTEHKKEILVETTLTDAWRNNAKKLFDSREGGRNAITLVQAWKQAFSEALKPLTEALSSLEEKGGIAILYDSGRVLVVNDFEDEIWQMSDAVAGDKPMHVRVVAAAIFQGGRLLLTQRDPMRGDYGYCWCVPGGKVKPGETDQQALYRECCEELGTEIIVGNRIKSVAFQVAGTSGRKTTIEVVYYAIERRNGTPRPLESIGIGWFGLPELRTLALTPADNMVIDVLCGMLRESL